MATRVSYDRAVNKIIALGNVLHRPLRDVLDSGARVLAISLAKSTQPSRGEGTGQESLDLGLRAVERDIRHIYKCPRDGWKDISHPGVKAAYWRAIKSGEFEVAEQFLRSHGSNLRNVPIGEFDGGAIHKSLLRKTRPVISRDQRPKLIVTDIKVLKRYVETVQKGEVGKAKGAWADVARALGKEPRGLRIDGDITASWITGKGHGYGKFARGGTDENPTIRITNSLDYTSQVLNKGSQRFAEQVAHNRMIENLEHAVKAEAKNLSKAA